MQVSFHGEVEDHVIIGGGVAQACGVDDSAEFLDMLSDTIYREKALAAEAEAMRLIEGGMSQREAARQTGVSARAIGRMLSKVK